MFAFTVPLLRNFFHKQMVGGMSTNVKRPYRIDARMAHDKRRRRNGRNVGTRRMMKS